MGAAAQPPADRPFGDRTAGSRYPRLGESRRRQSAVRTDAADRRDRTEIGHRHAGRDRTGNGERFSGTESRHRDCRPQHRSVPRGAASATGRTGNDAGRQVHTARRADPARRALYPRRFRPVILDRVDAGDPGARSRLQRNRSLHPAR